VTAYNVISPASLVAGQPEDISVILANLQAIQGVLNGGIDNANINGAAAISASKLAGYPSDLLKYLRGDGSWQAAPTIVVGDELAHAEVTVGSSVAATTEVGADTLLTAPAVTCDGTTPVIVEFFSPVVLAPSVAAAQLNFILFDGSTPIGQLGQVRNPAGASTGTPVLMRRKLTPTAGAHTYSARAYVSTGSGWFGAGTAGAGNSVPAYLRVLRVSPIPPSVAAGSFTATYYGTSFPVSPADGQEAILVDSTTAPTYQWLFRYNAAATTYKWEFIGGAPWTQFVAAGQAVTSTTYADPATPHTFTVPRAGTYLFTITAKLPNNSNWEYIGLHANNVLIAEVQSEGMATHNGAVDAVATIAAGQTLKAMFKTDVNTVTPTMRTFTVTPIRVA
jgi:hypothetical protein